MQLPAISVTAVKVRRIKEKSERGKRATQYEQFSRDVLAGLYERRKLNADVTHHVFLPSQVTDEKGKPLMRQVDVFVDFHDKSNKPFVVQCKNWKSAIPLPIIDSLVGMLSTLEQPCRGMFVAPSNYQKGALLTARHKGLELCILRPTMPTDFAERKIPSIDAWVTLRGIKSDQVQIEIPTTFSRKHSKKIRRLAQLKPGDIPIYDVDCKQIGTLEKLHDDVHERLGRERDYDEYQCCSPDQRTFLKINRDFGEIIKIRGRFKAESLEKKRMKNSISHIFGSSSTEEVFLIDEKRNVIKPGEEFSAETDCFDLKKHFPEWFKDEDIAV